MHTWIVNRNPRSKKEIRKFKKEKPDSGSYNWDLGFIFSDGLPESKTAKNRKESRERYQNKVRKNG